MFSQARSSQKKDNLSVHLCFSAILHRERPFASRLLPHRAIIIYQLIGILQYLSNIVLQIRKSEQYLHLHTKLKPCYILFTLRIKITEGSNKIWSHGRKVMPSE